MKEKELREIKELYQFLVWTILRNNKFKKKLPQHIQGILNQYNLIIDLIEEIEGK